MTDAGPDTGDASIDGDAGGSNDGGTDVSTGGTGGVDSGNPEGGTPTAGFRCIPVVPWAVSGDGKVVVGRSATYSSPAFWSNGVETVIECPPDVTSHNGQAVSASADGSVIVGSCQNFTSWAFRWTAATGLVFLGEPSPTLSFISTAADVSADGSVVVGRFLLAGDAGTGASVWTLSAGLRLDVPLAQGSAVSGDGAVIAGGVQFQPGPYRWTAASGLVSLENTSTIGSAIGDISTDGQVVVGNRYDLRIPGWVRWSPLGTAEVFPCRPHATRQQSCDAARTNGDGTVVVGVNDIWDAVHGLRYLAKFAGAYGLSLPEDAVLIDVSDDGKVIVGRTTNGYGTVGFILTLPESPTLGPDAGTGTPIPVSCLL